MAKSLSRYRRPPPDDLRRPSTYGQSITFTATISDTTGGVPTGGVKFYNRTTTSGSRSILSGGGNSETSTLTTSTLAAGVHSSISAVYTATRDFWGSSDSLSKRSTRTIDRNESTLDAYGGTVPH